MMTTVVQAKAVRMLGAFFQYGLLKFCNLNSYFSIYCLASQTATPNFKFSGEAHLSFSMTASLSWLKWVWAWLLCWSTPKGEPTAVFYFSIICVYRLLTFRALKRRYFGENWFCKAATLRRVLADERTTKIRAPAANPRSWIRAEPEPAWRDNPHGMREKSSRPMMSRPV